MLSDAERIKLYGSAEAVAAVDRRIAEDVASWPPLTPRQRDRLRTLLRPAYPKEAPVTEIAEPPRWESHADSMIAKFRAAGNETKVRYWERVKARVDDAPPLSPAVRDKLAVILRPEPSAPELFEDRQIRLAIECGDQAEADFWRRVKADVDQAPPLTPAVRDRLAVILRSEQPETLKPAPCPQPRRSPLPQIPRPLVQPRLQETKTAKVYVIGTGEDGRVKIGTTVDLGRRIGDISRMSPVPLKILWSTDGDYQLERALHEKFRARRLHGEWFDFAGVDAVALIADAAERLRETVDKP